MDALGQDIRYAARMLRQSAGFTVLAVTCLALGIGVNTTMFSVVNAVNIKPLPFTDAERLVLVQGTQRQSTNHSSLSYPDFQDVKAQAHSYTDVAGYSYKSITLAGDDEPERVQGSLVSWNLFPMLGLHPQLGRGFREDEDKVGGEPVVMLSDDLWRRRFNRDPRLIGRSILVDAAPRTVIGILPRRITFPQREEIWVPLAQVAPVSSRADRGVQIVGHLKPGVGLDQAAREASAIFARIVEQFPVEYAGWSATARPLRVDFIDRESVYIVLTMMGAVTFVLLIACANVANLLLARATTRGREIAIRSAIGAGRGRIVRQLLTESIMLALMGGVLGILLAYWGLDLLTAAIPTAASLPYYIHWSVDGPTLAYTVVLSVVTGIVFGLAPALRVSRGNLQGALREGGRGTSAGLKKNRLRAALVIAEVALSLVLLVGASLFVRSFMNLQRAGSGFDTASLMSLRLYLPGVPYDSAGPRIRRVQDVVRRLESLPGVTGVTASNLIPLGDGGDASGVVIDGRPVPRGQEPRVFWAGVTPHFLQTLQVPLVAGRDFTDAEGDTRSGVVVISQAMAKKLWPSADPLGHRFRFAEDTAAQWLTIIGVARDFTYAGMDERDALPAVWLPLPYMSTRNTGLVIRTAGDPARITGAAREQIRASDARMPVFDAQPMEQVRELSFWQYKLFGWMFSIFGAIALLLAVIGVYGVISFGVSQRTHEIGVRVALGARTADVLRLVVGQGVLLAVVGVLVGIAGAFGVTRVVGGILYDVSATDPLSFVGVSLLLVAVASVASWLPARRATGVDPITALRSD